MQVTHSQLVNELQTTAEALSRQRVILDFELMPREVKRGYCVTTQEGVFIIALAFGLSVEELYNVFLHETGHAYINGLGMKLPDPEAGAWEVARLWAAWLVPAEGSQRAPKDVNELIEFLRKLRRYHETNHNDYFFSGGANRGMWLPMATRIIAGGNRITGG